MNLSNGWPMMGSTGEIILFACTAIVMVACALGVLFCKKAAHSVICMIGVMLGLAILYIANSAPFLGVAQIVVYTGAIMMLFLFVIMLIGIGTSDDYARQSRGAIVAAVLGGLGLIVIVTTAILKSVPDTYAANEVNPYSNEPITDLAITLFQEHWLSMELAGGLLFVVADGHNVVAAGVGIDHGVLARRSPSCRPLATRCARSGRRALASASCPPPASTPSRTRPTCPPSRVRPSAPSRSRCPACCACAA